MKKLKRIYEGDKIVLKECGKCHEIKPVEEFNKDNANSSGYRNTCRECTKQYYKENKDHIKIQKEEYRENNKELIKQISKKYYKNNKEDICEKQREYKNNNKELIKKRNKIYREKNKERIKQEREENKERYRQYDKQRYKKNTQNVVQGIYEKVTKNLYPHYGVQYGIVYGVHNTITDRWYIGQTINSFDVRYHGNFFKCKSEESKEYKNKLLQEDIEKYGQKSFEIYEVLDIAFSEEELDALEVYYIDKYKAYDKGYNSNRGNINGKRSYREV